MLLRGRPHIPLGVHIANRSHSWNSNPENYIILYDMLITNIGDDYLKDAYVGLYFDCDVRLAGYDEGFDDDLTVFIGDEGIAYIIDNDGEPEGESYVEGQSLRRAFAVKLLKNLF